MIIADRINKIFNPNFMNKFNKYTYIIVSMMSCLEILNKIKYDRNLNKEDYLIYYLDNIKKKLIEISFNDIKETSKNFMILEDKEIPLYRIKEIRKKINL